MPQDSNQDLEVLLHSNSKQIRQLEESSSDEDIDGNSPPQKGLNIRPLLRIVRRRILLIIGISTLTTAAAFYSNQKSPLIYAGSFQLLVEPVTSEAKTTDPSAITGTPVKVSSGRGDELDYSTVFTILTSSEMLSSIVEKVKVDRPNFKVGDLRSGLTVERLISKQFGGKTKIVTVSYQGLNPKLVQSVLEKTAQRYLSYSLDERKSYIDQGIDFIEEQLPRLRQQVNALQSQLQKIQQQYNLIDPTKEGTELFSQVRQMNSDQLTAQRELQEQKTLYLNLEKQLRLTPDEALSASALSENPNYQKLVTQIKDIESQIATESARFLPDSPQIQALQEKRQNLQNLLDGEIQGILGNNSTITAGNPEVLAFQNGTRKELIKQMVDTANKISLLEFRSQSLARTKNNFERQAQQFPAVASQYNTIQRQLEITTKTLDQLLTQRETLKVQAAQNKVPWQIVSKPTIPRDADGKAIPSPNSSKKLTIGVAAGVILGLVAAIFYEKMRNIFYTTEDIEDTTKWSVLGKIPQDKRHKLLPNLPIFSKEVTATEDSDDSPFLNAFDSLYTNIRFTFFNSPIRSLVVCSAAPGDGKSKIALHLAKTAAATGKTVLLVDTNLRSALRSNATLSPSFYTELNLPNLKGLSDLLEKTLEPKDLIEQLPTTENLFILNSGQPLPNSPKRLASAHMQHLMDKFHARFDLVIYDSPNLLDYTDASFLAANTDGLLMVVTVGRTKQSLVQKARARIEKYGLPLLGVVVNRLKTGDLE